jgi:hypothetical protein
MHANFMLIATPDKHPFVQNCQPELSLEQIPRLTVRPQILVSIFKSTGLVFVLYRVGR